MDHKTDGFVPREVVVSWDPKRRRAQRLVLAELWIETEQNGVPGYQFHDWLDYQLSTAEMLERQQARSEAGRRGGVRSGASRRAKSAAKRGPEREASASEPSHDVSEAKPKQTRSSVKDKNTSTSVGSERCAGKGGSGGEALAPNAQLAEVVKSAPQRGAATDTAKAKPDSRGTRIPPDFAVTAEMVAWAREHVPDVDGRRETAKFKDYWEAKSGKDATKKDWVAAWRYWMRGAQDRLPANGRSYRQPTLTGLDAKLAGWESMKENPSWSPPALTSSELNNGPHPGRNHSPPANRRML